MTHIGRSMVLAIVVVAVGACSQSQPPADQAAINASPTPTPRRLSKDREEDRSLSIESARIVDAWPTVDGAAYAVSEWGQIWYVKGQYAVRVKEVEKLATRSGATADTKAIALALLTRESRRNRKLLNEYQDLEEKLSEVKSELSELKESRNDQ